MTQPRGRLFAWLARHPSEAESLKDVPPDVLGTLWADAWREGGRQTVHDTQQWGQIIGQLQTVIAGAEQLVSVLHDAELEEVPF